MSKGKDTFKKVTQKLTGVLSINNDQIEQLRSILEVEQQRSVTPEEAKEYGESLITIYKVLAGDREILGVDRIKENKDG